MARVLLLFFVVLTQGFCLLLMDSEYNYAANKDDKPTFRSSKGVLTCPTWSLKEHFKIIEREAALEFCTKDEDEDLIEAHSPTAPLDGLNDVLREIEVNSPPALQPEIIAPAPSDYNNDPDKEAIEERYIVKAVPMTAPHKEELIGEELEKTESDQDDNGDDSSTNETIDQDEEPELEEVKDSKVENDPEAAIPSTTHQPPPSSALNEAEIPSFGEWKQKALEEEQKKREEEKRKKEDEKKKLLLVNNAEGGKGSKEFNKTNGGLGGLFTKDSVAGSTVSGGLKKNFASLDCGAKIAAANAESASASNIFTTSRDEYMRNACSDQAWFIVELCESIKALKIEIANHELYSSVFKDFRVSLSNVFPGRDKDWTLFGTFEAKDERFSQAFVSDSDHGVFGKYVKVEILSHHGNEYFCPISSFKIYGVSEIELIGADDDDDDDDHDHDHDNVDFHHVSPAQPTSESTDARDDSMVFNVIKATFRIIAGVFAPNEQVKNLDMSHALNQSSLEGFTFLYEISCPSCDDNRLRDVYFLLAFNYAQLSHTLARNQGLKQALARNVCQYYGFNVQEDKSNKEATSIQSGFRMVEFYATLFGSSQIMALCNLISIASGSSPTVQSPIVLPPWKTRPYEATSIDTVNDTSKAEIIISKNHDQKHPSLVPPKETEAIVAADPILSSKSLLPDASFSKSSSIVSKPVVTETVKTFTGDKQMNVDSSVTSVIPSVTAKISSIPSSSQPPPSSSSSPSSPSSASKPKIDPTPASPSQSSQEPLKDPPDVVIVPPAATSNSDSNGQSSNTGGGGTSSQVQSQGQRESVWQKLSNKIKSLERNVSLSSGYLEELSVQYKKQIEDLQLAVRQSGEALSAASKAREYDRNQVKDLKEEIGQLKVVVEEVSTRMETMSTWAVVVHSLFLVIEIFVGILFVFACWTRPRQPHLPTVPKKFPSETAQVPAAPVSSSTPLKRRHSMQEKPLDDHHIEELNAVKHRRSSLDLTSRPVEGLSKRQKKRLQRRLSRANAILHESSNPIVNGGEEGVCQLRDSSLYANGQPRLKLNNTFGLLNHSQHHDPESEALSNKKRLVGLLNGSNGSTRSVTPESRRSTPSHKAVRGRPSSSSLKKSKKRSKSTSPARCLKNESLMSKRKDLIKNFDPDNVNWIQTTTTTTMKT